MTTLSFSTLTCSKQTNVTTAPGDAIRWRVCYKTVWEGHLEGGQAVQTGEVLDVSGRYVKARAVPRAAHVSF